MEIAFDQKACKPVERLNNDIVEHLIQTFEEQECQKLISTLVARYQEATLMVLGLASRLQAAAPEESFLRDRD